MISNNVVSWISRLIIISFFLFINTGWSWSPHSSILTNPGFEQEMSHEGSLKGWKYNCENGSANIMLDHKVFIEGTTSIKIEAPEVASAFIQQEDINVKGGWDYVLSFWAKTVNFNSASRKGLSVLLSFDRGEDKRFEYADLERGTKEWRRLFKRFHVPPQSTKAKLGIGFSDASGNLWIDDVGFFPLRIVLIYPGYNEVVSDPSPTLRWVGFSSTVLSREEWSQEDLLPGFTLEYSQDKNFYPDNTFRVEGLLNHTYSPNEPLSNGTWYWRVSIAQGRSKFNSHINSFEVNADLSQDLTAPSIYDAFPFCTDRLRPLIGASFVDDKKSKGIDHKAIVLTLDGEDITNQAEITADKIRYQPRVDLDYGLHRVNLLVRDRAGNESRKDWYFSLTKPLTNKVTIDKKGWVCINGQPFFMNGFYSVQPYYFSYVKNELGMNTVLWGTSTLDLQIEYLDKAEDEGLKVIIAAPYGDSGLREVERMDCEAIGKRVVKLRSHPAFLTWYFDEPETRIELITLLKFYRFVKALNPDHPVTIVNWAPCYYANTAKVCDIIMSDPYPCNVNWEYLENRDPEGEHIAHPPTFIGYAIDETRKAASKAGGKRSYWTFLQDFEGVGWTYPTLEQSRCMHYLALVHEVRGINRYRFYARNMKEINGELSSPRYDRILKETSWEMNELATVIMFGETRTIALSPDTTLVEALLKEYQGKYYLMAVNGDRHPAQVTFVFPVPLEGAKAIFENRNVRCLGNSFEDNFLGYAVHVYKIE